MDKHSFDPIALIAGLFFGLAGIAMIADQQWDDLDVTAFTAAGVMVIGLVLAAMIVARYVLPDQTGPDTDTVGSDSDRVAEAEVAIDEAAPGHEA